MSTFLFILFNYMRMFSWSYHDKNCFIVALVILVLWYPIVGFLLGVTREPMKDGGWATYFVVLPFFLACLGMVFVFILPAIVVVGCPVCAGLSARQLGFVVASKRGSSKLPEARAVKVVERSNDA